MIRLWQCLMRKLHRTSPATLEAERRLQEVHLDDVRVNKSVSQGKKIVRENHLGPLIAQLFERH
jgi:hypothetical protein